MSLKYAFMSFSCPDYSIDEMLNAAILYGYKGIEPRVRSGHKHGIEPGIDEFQCQTIKQKCENAGIQICCLATSCVLADPQNVQQNIEEAVRCLQLASAVGSPAIRVFGGTIKDGIGREEASTSLVQALLELAPLAEELGVTICLETHDDWCNPMDVASVMKQVNHPYVAVNWDVMHPVRTSSLTIDLSYETLKPWIKHVHMHDGLTLPGDIQFRPIGDGEIDHKRVVALLQKDNYSGFISGEWINWESAEVHLSREIKKMMEYEGGTTLR